MRLKFALSGLCSSVIQRRAARWTFVCGLSVAAGLGTAPAARAESVDAATRASARKLALDGIAELQRGNAERASEKLEKAYQLMRVPSVGLWSARAFAKRGLLVEASERYRETTRLSAQPGENAVQSQARKDAQTEFDALTPRIPSLVVAVDGLSGVEPQLTLDGAELPAALLGEERPVNPGEHRVRAEAQGEAQQEVVTLTEAQSRRVTLHFKIQPKPAASSPPPSAPQPHAVDVTSSAVDSPRVLPYLALGVGGAALIVGSVSGALALEQKRTIDRSDDCQQNRCLPSMQHDVNRLQTLRTLSTVGFIGAGVFIAGGVTLWLTSAKPSQSALGRPRLRYGLGPASANISGEF